MKPKEFIIWSEFGEMLDVADHLQNVEKQEVDFFVPNHDYEKIGNGIVNKFENKWDWLDCFGKGYIWLIDGCSDGKLQDYLRGRNEQVFGGSFYGDRLENERQLNQKWFKKAGFLDVESHNFKSIDDMLKFVLEHRDKQWVLKQNSDAPKSINHIQKFETGEDMVYHIKELKKKWNDGAFGVFDCDLMEKVEGLEVAASVFFNGQDYCKNKKGKVVGYLNFEEKKECDDGMGETTGEMGTTFIGVDENNKLFKEILMKSKLIEVLRASKFRGVFDINCIKTKKGLVALEPTMRPGIPGSSYEFLEGLDMDTYKMLDIVSSGATDSIEIKQGFGMVMVVAAKPYPVEAEVEDNASSIGERLWILNKEKPIKDFTPDQRRHIHLENFEKVVDEETGEMCYKVATKNGYLLTVTGRNGRNIESVRKNLINYIKQNLYISGMKYRTDIGKRVEKYI
jgi:phosphoribosylamine---glycine ligase